MGLRRHSFLVIFGPFFKSQSLDPDRSCGSAVIFFFGHFRPFLENPEFQPSPQLWFCGDILFCVIFGPFLKIQSLHRVRSCGCAATFFFGHFRPFFRKPEFGPSPQLWVCGDILFCVIFGPFSGIQSLLSPHASLSGPLKSS